MLQGTIFAPVIFMDQNKMSLDLVRRIMTDDRRDTLAETIMRGPEALLFGTAGNINIIRFTIINFAYNVETISRTFVTRSTSSRTMETGIRDCCLGLNSAAG